MENKMSDQIRRLDNKVSLSGQLAEMSDIREGVDSSGVPYILFTGKIKCGDTAVSTVRFRTFVKSKKKDGSDSKLYANAVNWAKTAIPMSKDRENATWVNMVGSLSDKAYVSKDGNFVDTLEYSMQMFNAYTEYEAKINIEGFIVSVTDEIVNDVETGRKEMRIVSRDAFGTMLNIEHIKVPSELAEVLEENDYVRGRTAKFFLSLIPSEEKEYKKSGGIGIQRTEGTSKLEMVLVGASPVYDIDSQKSLDPSTIKRAMDEKNAQNEERKAKGYVGSNKGIGFKSAMSNTKITVSPLDDEEIPF